MKLKTFLFLWMSLLSYPAFADNDTTPQKLSFDFQKISVRDLIGILAKYSDQNVILSDKIPNQEMSLHLQQVTWQEALAMILNSEGLAQRQMGNTLIIAPMADITQQQDD